MRHINFDFGWPVAESYSLESVPTSKTKTRASGTIIGENTERSIPMKIVASGQTVLKQPFGNDFGASLGVQLLRHYQASIGGDEDERIGKTALGFASQFGLLMGATSEPLGIWRDTIRTLMVIQKLSESGNRLDVGKHVRLVNITMNLIGDPITGHYRMVMKPANLRDAIIFEMASDLARGGRFLVCQQCGGYFTAGIDGKRGDSLFCSPGCRSHYHNVRRPKKRAAA